jgi:hypothetical protein
VPKVAAAGLELHIPSMECHTTTRVKVKIRLDYRTRLYCPRETISSQHRLKEAASNQAEVGDLSQADYDAMRE